MSVFGICCFHDNIVKFVMVKALIIKSNWLLFVTDGKKAAAILELSWFGKGEQEMTRKQFLFGVSKNS